MSYGGAPSRRSIDPHGYQPLVIDERVLTAEDRIVIASESCSKSLAWTSQAASTKPICSGKTGAPPIAAQGLTSNVGEVGLEPSVELDYSGLHPRLCYHLAGIKLLGDPYALWGDKTTPPMRLMAKVMINAALNAKDATSAISDCNRAMSTFHQDRKTRKSGKALADAITLQTAARTTGLKFKDVHAVAMRKHSRIADQFCTDAGMRLMRIDSEIALGIMYHFAKQGIPCLGIHDSFVVPHSSATELRRVMRLMYRRRTGFNPVIK
jgi:hypothetical protein